ncbi:MAG: TetR/AcrR family transcriptional regulator [Sandarakinorhabdus sp.]|nr:TetR/AcrR family transcriptional regulator [Sandarakinorhabdus sp.]
MATRAIDIVKHSPTSRAAPTQKTESRSDSRARRYDPAETKQRVLAAAHMLFSTKGFAGTGPADIAREADVSEGSIFYHFGSKKALLAELGVRHGRMMIEAMEAGNALEDLEPGIIIPRVFEFCRVNLMWQGMGEVCSDTGPKAAIAQSADAEPFYHAAKATTTEWIHRQMTIAMAKRGITGVDIEIAASFTHHIVGDAIDRVLMAPTPEEAARVEKETVRFVRAACNYPTH